MSVTHSSSGNKEEANVARMGWTKGSIAGDKVRLKVLLVLEINLVFTE